MYIVSFRDRHKMADHSKHPCYKAILQSMENITQIVVYNEIKIKLLSKELITLDSLDEFDRLGNREAVLKITTEVMRTVTGCEEFIKTLQEMPQQQYTELAKVITDKREQNSQNIANGTDTDHCTAIAPNHQPHITEQACNLTQIMEETNTLINTLLQQGMPQQIMSVVQAMKLKKCVGKCFTEALMQIITMLKKAIERRVITLKTSQEKSTIDELTDHYSILFVILNEFCRDKDDTPSLNHSVQIVVTRAMKVKDIIRRLQKIHWLSFCQSAKIISALVPLFEIVARVVREIQHIDCKPLLELLGSVVDLQASLHKIEKILKGIKHYGEIGCIIGVVSGIGSIVVGAVLFFTGVSAPFGVPTMILGVSAIGVSIASRSGIKCLSWYFNNSVTKGQREGCNFANQSDVLEQTN